MEEGSVQRTLEERFADTLLRSLKQQDIDKIRTTAHNLVDDFSKPENDVGLLYGKVQSGKTNNMLMSIARANDIGYRFFVILTSDNVSLYQQTFERTRRGLSTLFVIGNNEVNSDGEILERCRTSMQQKGVVMVSTKNQQHLRNLQTFIDRLAMDDLVAVVFDDEADYGSLNSRINQQNREQSTIHTLIGSLRGKFADTKFIQVTATPQAILLQRQDDPFRPKFVVTMPPGTGYIGGERLFDRVDDDVRNNVQRVISSQEIEDIVGIENYQGRPIQEIPNGIRQALCTFLVGASLKHLTEGDVGGENDKFSMLCHISSKKSAHKSLYSLVHRYTEIISHNLAGNDANYQDIMDCLRKAYDDLSSTFNGQIDFDQVISTIHENIFSTNVQVIMSGRNKQDPAYNSLFNIMVGGERLGRGLTVPRLLVTYYGRRSGAPKVDTILQHSRVYGYRSGELDVMRIFSTDELFNTYYGVYKSDEEQWDYFSSGQFEASSPVVLSLARSRRLRPTRNQVIPVDNLIRYFPGRTYILYQAIPSNIDRIDELVETYDPASRYAQLADKELLKQLIELCDTEKPEQQWNKRALQIAIDSLVESRGCQTYLLVRKDRDIMKGYRAVLDERDSKEIKPENGIVLFLYRIKGEKQGWEGHPLWIPVIRFPEGNAFYFTSKNIVSQEGGD